MTTPHGGAQTGRPSAFFQQRKQRWRRAEIVAGLIAVFLIFVMIVDVARNGPRAKRVEQELEAELSGIPPPEGAYLVGRTTGSKPRQARAGRTYRCTLSRAAIWKHYDRELRERGWVPLASGASSGSEYRRGAYHAIVEFGRYADWDFGIDLVWTED